MQFRIADTFVKSLARLTGNEQKVVKTTAFDLQLNPSKPGMSFHRLNAIRDPNFWSVRASRDIRLIVHRSENALLLCYVDHHDKAYQWAERRMIETHPRTGAAQLVELPQTESSGASRFSIVARSSDSLAPGAVKPKDTVPPMFSSVSEEDLLRLGVPLEWVNQVLEADEDQLLDLVERLPSESAEALLDFATGGEPRPALETRHVTDPFEHPDAKRRFRTMEDAEELEQALDHPWDTWAVFLHPAQRGVVERDFAGPARVAGSAGTGKTIVALHRAAHLARIHPDCRILLTTFSKPLANALEVKLNHLISHYPRVAERLEVAAIDEIGERLYSARFGKPEIVAPETLTRVLQEIWETEPIARVGAEFLMSEWTEVVDAWQLQTWEAYRDVKRLGRKTRLPEQQRAKLWRIFQELRMRLRAMGAITHSEMYSRLTEDLPTRRNRPFDYAIVDESQDISVPQLQFLAALGSDRPDALFFAGDLGQRIFQLPFSWKSLGVDVRGRSTRLRINYRTSHQIRRQADRLLEPEVSDVDGNVEERHGTVSVFNGPRPDIRVFDTIEDENAWVRDWIVARIKDGIAPSEICIIVRSESQFGRARAAAQGTSVTSDELDEMVAVTADRLPIVTMHLAKGLEFRAVAVMACDDEVLPLYDRIESAADIGDLDDILDTERHLLYVACTRARDILLVTGVNPASEFLDDLLPDSKNGLSPST